MDGCQYWRPPAHPSTFPLAPHCQVFPMKNGLGISSQLDLTGLDVVLWSNSLLTHHSRNLWYPGSQACLNNAASLLPSVRTAVLNWWLHRFQEVIHRCRRGRALPFYNSPTDTPSPGCQKYHTHIFKKSILNSSGIGGTHPAMLDKIRNMLGVGTCKALCSPSCQRCGRWLTDGNKNQLARMHLKWGHCAWWSVTMLLKEKINAVKSPWLPALKIKGHTRIQSVPWEIVRSFKKAE